MIQLKTLDDINVKDKRILVRVDYNVPVHNEKVMDNMRIKASLTTINELIYKGAKQIILMSHLGKPEKRFNKSLSLLPVGAELSKLISEEVEVVKDFFNSGLPKKKIILLENLRFNPGEEENNEIFAKALAKLGEIFVNDAFGACHRKHASVYSITKFIDSYAGRLLEKEIKTLSDIFEKPKAPFITLLGCAKIKDKIEVMKVLLKRSDKFLLGGAAIFTFFKALGYNIGKSLVDDKHLGLAKELYENYKEKILFPEDIIIKRKEEILNIDYDKIEDEDIGLDIGVKSIERFKSLLKSAKTIFWNGPMGKFEEDPFGKATSEIGNFITGLNAIKVAGGGDTIRAIRKYGLEKGFTFISTGGGASLKFIENIETKDILPCLEGLIK